MIEADYGEWLARGQAHQQAARPIDAMLCYRQALKSNRNAVQVQFQLGEVLRDLGRREDAIAAFRMALKWQPKHLSSLVALAASWETARRRRLFITGMPRFDPRNAEVREGLARLARAT
jgi:tetratricopeptide (TPR) repeat protein